MAKEIFMPKLSSTMEVGTLLQWYKEVGDAVEVGDPLFEIMTDKINIEVESYEDGILLAKFYEVDEQIPVNEVIGYIGESGEPIPDKKAAMLEPTELEPPSNNIETNAVVMNNNIRATPAARKIARDQHINLTTIEGSGPKGRIQKADVQSLEQYSKATPLAKKLADDLNVPLEKVNGTGVHHKIKKQDVLNYKPSTTQLVKTQKLTGMRKAIAQKMSFSASTAPHVTLHSTVDMTSAQTLRTQLLPIIEKQHGVRLTYTDIIMFIVTKALQLHPTMNATIEEDIIHYHDQVNVGMAVALEQGLIVPVLHQTDEMGLSDVAIRSKEIVALAKDNKLSMDQLSGGTFTISNLGGYDIDHFTPIINTPEVAILGVGRMKQDTVVVNNQIEIRPMMGISLSFDHRVIDGAPAAAFLSDLKRLMENPFELLL